MTDATSTALLNVDGVTPELKHDERRPGSFRVTGGVAEELMMHLYELEIATLV